MMENCFDRSFENLLMSGTRKDRTDYRNCIIAELQSRVSTEQVEPIREAFSEVLEEQYAKKIRCAFMASVFGLILMFNCIITCLCIGEHLLGLVIFNVFVAGINIGNIIVNASKYRYENMVYLALLKTDIYIERGIPSMAETFPEIFEVIYRDTDETLRRKKQILDEILGF